MLRTLTRQMFPDDEQYKMMAMSTGLQKQITDLKNEKNQLIQQKVFDMLEEKLNHMQKMIALQHDELELQRNMLKQVMQEQSKISSILIDPADDILNDNDTY